MPPWRTREFMLGIVFAAIEMAALRASVFEGSLPALLVLLFMSWGMPVFVGLWLVIRRFCKDHTNTTIY